MSEICYALNKMAERPNLSKKRLKILDFLDTQWSRSLKIPNSAPQSQTMLNEILSVFCCGFRVVTFLIRKDYYVKAC